MSRKKELSPEQRAECEAAKARYPDEEVSAASMHEVPIMGRVIWRGGALG